MGEMAVGKDGAAGKGGRRLCDIPGALPPWHQEDRLRAPRSAHTPVSQWSASFMKAVWFRACKRASATKGIRMHSTLHYVPLQAAVATQAHSSSPSAVPHCVAAKWRMNLLMLSKFI